MILGILTSLIVACIAKLSSGFIHNLGSVSIAIIIGMVIRNSFNLGSDFDKGTKLIEKKILPIAIMLLGAKLNFSILISLGFKSIIFICFLVTITILSGYLLANHFGFSRDFGLLLGTGNAVCGSSAIAASSQVLDVDEESIGLSIAIVNLMGTIGIFLVPLLTKLLHFNDTNSGLLIGGTLQAVGQAVAAGFSINENVGKISTIIKMGRVLTLGVVIIIFDLINPKVESAVENNFKKIRLNIPFFIIGFFILSLVSTLDIFPRTSINLLAKYGKYLLLFSMSAIGLRINFKSLISKGIKLLSFELLIETIQLTSAVILIYFLF